MLPMKPEQMQAMRKELGLTQAELASTLGVNRMAVTQWETGIRKPSRMAVSFIRHLIADRQEKGGLVSEEQVSYAVDIPPAEESPPMDHAELRKLREVAGWTQAEFARRLGITINHYSRIERGDIREGMLRPITRTVAILARLLVRLQNRDPRRG